MSIEVHTAETLLASNSSAKTEGGDAVAKAGASAPNTSAPGSEKTSEQNAAVESETSETEVEEEESEEPVATDDKDVVAKTGDETNAQPKKMGGIQKRVDKLNKRVTAAQQEAEYWKAEALKNATAPKQAQVEQAKPTSEGKPSPDAFNTHSEYVEALTDWKTDQKFKEHDKKIEQAKLTSAQAKANETNKQRMDAFAAKTPDFKETLENLDDVPSSPAVREIIITSESGPELLYELAKNPEEAKRIALLGPLAAAREMGKIEARLSSSKASDSKQETKKISQAPNPIAPVGGGGKATTPKTLEEASKSSYADYKRVREAQLKKRRQA